MNKDNSLQGHAASHILRFFTNTYQSTMPSASARNRSLVFGFMGRTCLQSGSFSKALFIQLTKAYFSSSTIDHKTCMNDRQHPKQNFQSN